MALCTLCYVCTNGVVLRRRVAMPETTEQLRRPKLVDVARRAGVANATASRALSGVGRVSEDARRRILEAAAALKYKPNRSAQALKGGRSGMIGMVVPRLSDRFFASCVDAVEAFALDNASLLVVAATHDRSDRTLEAVKQLLHHNVDGLVLATSEHLTGALVRSLRSVSIPVVGIDAPLSKAGLPSVLTDNLAGAALATEHLLEHGYQRVVSVQANPKLFTMQERRRGYEATMRAAGLRPTQHVIDSPAEAAEVLRAYRDQPGLTAFFAGNEVAAKCMVTAARSLRLRMPEHFAMGNFDDFDLADYMETTLTVVRQPTGSIGEQAARILFRNMRNEKSGDSGEPRETILEATLVIRNSCGCHTAE